MIRNITAIHTQREFRRYVELSEKQDKRIRNLVSAYLQVAVDSRSEAAKLLPEEAEITWEKILELGRPIDEKYERQLSNTLTPEQFVRLRRFALQNSSLNHEGTFGPILEPELLKAAKATNKQKTQLKEAIKRAGDEYSKFYREEKLRHTAALYRILPIEKRRLLEDYYGPWPEEYLKPHLGGQRF